MAFSLLLHSSSCKYLPDDKPKPIICTPPDIDFKHDCCPLLIRLGLIALLAGICLPAPAPWLITVSPLLLLIVLRSPSMFDDPSVCPGTLSCVSVGICAEAHNGSTARKSASKRMVYQGIPSADTGFFCASMLAVSAASVALWSTSACTQPSTVASVRLS